MSEALSKFKKKLSGGEYETLTGARRAVGKMKDMSDDERNTARRAADKYFDGKPQPAVKKKTAKKVAKKAEKKAAAGPGPGRGRKAKTNKKSEPKAAAKPAKKATVGVAKPTKVLNTTDVVMKELRCYEIAIDKLKDISAQVDVKQALELARDGIHKCVATLQGVKLTVTGGNGAAKAAVAAPAQKPVAAPAPAPAPAPPGALPGGLPGMPGAI